MAPHLTTLAKERIRTRRWSGGGVGLDEVAERMARMRAQLAHDEAEEPGRPHTRGAVMNMLVCGDSRLAAEAAARAAKALALHHPSRTVVVVGESARREAMDAEVEIEWHLLMGSPQVAYEQVVLRVPLAALEGLPAMVAPLLLGDVPTYLWWTGARGVDRRALSAAPACQAWIVDSATFMPPGPAIVELARLAGAATLGLGDLHWARSGPWREALAQAFNAPTRRPLLGAVTEVAIRHGRGSGGLAAALLLAGWLAARLRWRLLRPGTFGGEEVEARFQGPGGREVRVTAGRGGTAGHEPAALEAVSVVSSWRGRRGAVELSSRGGGGGAIVVESTGPGEALRYALPVGSHDEADLLCNLIPELTDDRVYSQSLRAAAQLVASG
ncbi:MAG: glucose-6-phosphate dehydrogenase assembly protein OpcA [Candidatus Dormibacterales bacterium]